ncbi:MAG: YbaB/EbfC family nucleoid-associated protein [Spirochaetes bacterium]|jgi:hypothetical protein|nr:YbaB/EbfC family nucleoid-associated protein [Spirochaetota bacterium]
MFKDLGDNLGQIMKLQKQMKDIQKSLQKKTASGESQDGTVKVKVNGEFQMQDITIDDSLLQAAGKDKLRKNIIAAVNAAVNGSKDAAANEMSGLTSKLNIPGLSDLFK